MSVKNQSLDDSKKFPFTITKKAPKKEVKENERQRRSGKPQSTSRKGS